MEGTSDVKVHEIDASREVVHVFQAVPCRFLCVPSCFQHSIPPASVRSLLFRMRSVIHKPLQFPIGSLDSLLRSPLIRSVFPRMLVRRLHSAFPYAFPCAFLCFPRTLVPCASLHLWCVPQCVTPCVLLYKTPYIKSWVPTSVCSPVTTFIPCAFFGHFLIRCRVRCPCIFLAFPCICLHSVPSAPTPPPSPPPAEFR